MLYGMPYMGSKNKIAKWVIDHIPASDYLYDLFGGGGAITHCAYESGKFKNIIYNELDPLTFKAFDMAIHGLFENENRWISREDFNKLKSKDPYVAICFSFGNDLRSYAYSKDKEKYKKALHYAICFDDFSLLENLGVKLKRKSSGRIELTKQVKELLSLNKLQMKNLEALNHLQSLERLEHLQHLDLTNKDYADVQIKENSVIYCDPPYKNTGKYRMDFNYENFYEWCGKQKQLVIISEYAMPQDRFVCVAQKEKISLMCSSNRTTKTEKLFIPKHQYQMYLGE